MRLSVAVALSCFCTVSFAADPPHASIEKNTHITSEGLAAALETLAKDYNFQVLYRTEIVKDLRTRGAIGTLTSDEALTKVLSGTGLTYKYIDAQTVTVIPIATTAAGTDQSQSNPQNSSKGGGKNTSQDFRMAQMDHRTITSDSSVEDGSPAHTASAIDNSSALAEILVTGSRIMNVDVKRTEDDPQPYTVIDSTTIENSGAVTLDDLLKQQLTMNTTVQSNAQAGPGSTYGATSSINLRGLGSNETLILVDGRRMAGATNSLGAENQPDINGIPLAAIERVEVLPSSASAIYGGAAMGGVVNIILKKNFQGGEVSGTYGNATQGSSQQRSLDAAYGMSLFDDRTHIMISGHYSDGDPPLVEDRLDIVQRNISTLQNNNPSYLENILGVYSGATPNIASADGSNLALKSGTILNSPFTSIPAGTAPGATLLPGLLPGSFNSKLSPGLGAYGLVNALAVVPVNKSLMATVRQELIPEIELFTEFSTSSNSTRQSYNPISASSFTVPAGAPTNPFQQDVSISFPSNEGAPNTTDSVTQSATVGLLTHFTNTWNGELDYTWSQNSFAFVTPTTDGSSLEGALASGSVNPFADTIEFPPTLAPYFATLAYGGESSLNDLALRTSGPLPSFPWGAPTLTVGVEHRKEGTHDSTYTETFPLQSTNDVNWLFFGQSQDTDSIYAEAEVPLVTSMNSLPLLRQLDLQIAVRSERYTAYIGTPYEYITPVFYQAFNPPQGAHDTVHYTSTNPTFALKYKPHEDVTIRASYAKAFLPPTASQLLANPTPTCGFACTPITDPKTGQTYSVDVSGGGNPDLAPQTAKSWDLGVIWEPQEDILQGLRIDLEYYKISQPNYITNPSPQEVVSNPIYASRVTRDPATGLITLVNTSYVNATEYKTEGYDLTLGYRKQTRIGLLSVHASGTDVAHDWRQYTINSPTLDYVGYPADGGEPRYKAAGTVGWELGSWAFQWTTRYLSGYRQTESPGSPSLINFGPNPMYTDAQGGDTIASQIYHDLLLSYRIGGMFSPTSSGEAHTALSDLTVQFGVKNVFNRLPPFDAYYEPFFYSPYGDPRLRTYWMSIKTKL
jgi:iron complex outermembrane receptor protein